MIAAAADITAIIGSDNESRQRPHSVPTPRTSDVNDVETRDCDVVVVLRNDRHA